MKKLLVTGASGFLGWNLCRVARGEWDLFGTVFRNEHPVPGVNLRRLDLTSYTEFSKYLHEIRPDAVIHTAAITQPNFCQQHPKETYKINVEASADLAGICADLSIPFVFTSSDLVFDGLHPPYREEDPVCPISIYGEQKAEAERVVLKRYPRSSVCRMALIFGDAGPGAASFIQPWIGDMKAGRAVNLFTDEYRSPISARDAGRGILLALATDGGILHLAGPESLSRYDFGKLLREMLGLQNADLIPCRRNSIKMPAPRPADVSLDISKAVGLGFRPGSLKEELGDLDSVGTNSSR